MSHAFYTTPLRQLFLIFSWTSTSQMSSEDDRISTDYSATNSSDTDDSSSSGSKSPSSLRSSSSSSDNDNESYRTQVVAEAQEKSLQDYTKEATDGFVYPGVQRSGSKPKLDQVSTQCINPDSEVKYRRKLAKNGRILIREARKRRRETREVLRSTGKDITGVESSSEEDEDEEDRLHPLSRMVDWYEFGRSKWWADVPVFNAMPVSAVSSAVGWAHHQTHDGMNHYITVEEMNSYLDLPNTPMPSSHLEWIAERTTKRVKRQIVSWKNHTYLSSADYAAERLNTAVPQSNLKRLEWQTWGYDSQDETYQQFKSFKPKRTVDVTIPFVRKVHVAETCMTDLLCTSGRVALGIVLEELLTASLLSLAREHVKRCRTLDEQMAFNEWALPPEDAILKISPGAASLGSAENMVQRSDFDQWCSSRNLDPTLVLKNKDLYGRVHPFCLAWPKCPSTISTAGDDKEWLYRRAVALKRKDREGEQKRPVSKAT